MCLFTQLKDRFWRLLLSSIYFSLLWKGLHNSLVQAALQNIFNAGCEIGFVRQDGRCVACPSGTYWYRYDNQLTGCVPCPIGYFSDTPGQIECKACGLNSVTLFRSSTSREDCFCSAGFKPKDSVFSANSLAPYDCVQCDSMEWCIPGKNVPFWTASQLCLDQRTSSLCSRFPVDQYPRTRGRCIFNHLCPTSLSTPNSHDGCGHPYAGVKCFNCVSTYSKSLLGGIMRECVPCYFHWIFLIVTIVSVSAIILFVSYLLCNHDYYNPCEAVILLRIFQQHWQHLAVLRYSYILWPNSIKSLMQLITMDFPLAETLSCLFQKEKMRTSIQVAVFLPVFYIFWGIFLVYLSKKITSFINSQPKVLKNNLTLDYLPQSNSLPADIRLTLGLTSYNMDKLISYIFSLFLLFFVSLSSTLFYGVQCITLEATGFAHGLAAPDFVCDRFWGWHLWAIVGIVIYVWLLPILFFILFFYKIHEWCFSREGELWGYFFHGYREETIMWQSIVMLRFSILISLIGIGGSYKGPSMIIKFGESQVYTQRMPEGSHYGSFISLLCAALIYCLSEIFKEILCVSGLGVGQRFIFLERLSVLSILFTYLTALLLKSTSHTLLNFVPPLSSVLNDNDDFYFSQLSRSADVVEVEIFQVLGIVTIALHILFISVTLYHLFRLQMEKYNDNFSLTAKVASIQHLIKNTSNIFFILFHRTSPSREEFLSTKKSLVAFEFQDFHTSQVNNLTLPKQLSVSSFVRSSKLRTISKEDIMILRNSICRVSPEEYDKAFAALLRTSLEPFSRVATLDQCLTLLKKEGFRKFDCTHLVEAFFCLRRRVLARLKLLDDKRFSELSWITRGQSVLRYPVLKDTSLQIVPPVDKDDYNKDIMDEKSTNFGWRFYPRFRSFFSFLQGRSHSSTVFNGEFSSKRCVEEFSTSRHSINELCQHIIQCFVLDLAQATLGISYKVTTDRYLMDGVPLGTRNDGRTDAGIREDLKEIKNGSNSNILGENSPSVSTFGVIQRRHLNNYTLVNHHGPLKDSVANQPRFDEYFRTTDKESEQLKIIEELTNFFTVFPDARPGYHCITGIPDRCPNPVQIIPLLRGKKFSVPRENGSENSLPWLEFIEDLLKDLKKKIMLSDASYTTHDISQNVSETGIEVEDSVDLPLVFPILSLICLHGEFSVEPQVIAIYVTENLLYVKGPDGCLTGIDTGAVNPQTSSSSIDVRGQSISLDPIVEIASPFTQHFINGEADWTLESWIFLKETFLKSHQGWSYENKIRTLCASEDGDSLFSLKIDTSEFGLWNSTQTKSFEPFEPYLHVTEPITLDQLNIPNWFFATVTFHCSHENEYDIESGINSTFCLYINGKLGGGIVCKRAITNIEVIGNNCDGDQPFGIFSELCVLPVCFREEQVMLRYKLKCQTLKRHGKKCRVKVVSAEK